MIGGLRPVRDAEDTAARDKGGVFTHRDRRSTLPVISNDPAACLSQVPLMTNLPEISCSISARSGRVIAGQAIRPFPRQNYLLKEQLIIGDGAYPASRLTPAETEILVCWRNEPFGKIVSFLSGFTGGVHHAGLDRQ